MQAELRSGGFDQFRALRNSNHAFGNRELPLY